MFFLHFNAKISLDSAYWFRRATSCSWWELISGRNVTAWEKEDPRKETIIRWLSYAPLYHFKTSSSISDHQCPSSDRWIFINSSTTKPSRRSLALALLICFSFSFAIWNSPLSALRANWCINAMLWVTEGARETLDEYGWERVRAFVCTREIDWGRELCRKSENGRPR